MTPRPGRAPIRVVLADDAPALRDLLRTMLELDGFEVVAAVGSGTEVLALLDAGLEADVVVLDDRMPDLDGVEVARLVRARRPGQVVLVHTAFPHPDLEAAARDAGVAAVLGKADGIEALEQAITRAAGLSG